MLGNPRSRNILIFLIVSVVGAVMFCVGDAHAAVSRRVVGIVKDADTGEPLSFVNVYSKKHKQGTTTDLKGIFTLHVPAGAQIECTSLGYSPMTLKAPSSASDTLRFLLSPSSTTLTEVVVKPKKKKYSKKNNPAVELMKKVREHRDLHNPLKSDAYSYDRYDKMVIGLNDYKGYSDIELLDSSGLVHKKKLSRKGKLMTSLIDTAIWTGKRILDLSLKEKLATRIAANNGGIDKEVVRATKSDGFDKALDEDYTRVFFEDVLREVDIYDNDINVLLSRFVSPLSPLGPDYYMYHIEDTVRIGNDRCVEVSFAPHNAESLGFNGKLFIPADDSVKYVRRALLRLPKAANVNYVDNLILSQNFELDSLGNTRKVLDDMVVEMRIVSGTQGLYLTRQSRYDNFRYSRRPDLADFYDKIGDKLEFDDTGGYDVGFWNDHRLVPLTYAESQLNGVGSPFRKIPFLYWVEKGIELIIKGYIRTGKNSRFDFGPIDTFIAHNATEGWRFKVGGLTTANLSKRIFARGYVAYGIGDHKFKGGGELEYSFLDKKYQSREFPVNAIRGSYYYDVFQLGQNINSAFNNLLNSWKRLDSNLSVYRAKGTLEYNIEWRNHLSLHTSLNYERNEQTPFVGFVDGFGNRINHYTQNSMRVRLRFAPGEKFVQSYNERKLITRDALVLELTHDFGPKGLFGSNFTLNSTEFLCQKRVWLSAFGYTDIFLRAGKLWNKAQFPALLWQNANTSWTMQPERYALLNPMEFAMDEYVSLDFTYHLNGLLFNRIPLLKKLKLREVVSFKGFVGHLTSKNNPANDPSLFRFPDPNTSPMGKTPYMEIGVGIENIITFLRLDYVWRITYRDKPGCPNSGLRFSFHFGF